MSEEKKECTCPACKGIDDFVKDLSDITGVDVCKKCGFEYRPEEYENKSCPMCALPGVGEHDPYAVDWSKVPEWANVVITNPDGERWAFQRKPTLSDHKFVTPAPGKMIGLLPNNPSWRKSMRLRPGTNGEPKRKPTP